MMTMMMASSLLIIASLISLLSIHHVAADWSSSPWTAVDGTYDDDLAWAISSSSTGVFMAGSSAGRFSNLNNSGRSDLLLARYAPDTGVRTWTLLFGSSEEDRLLAITDEGDGFVYAAGFVGRPIQSQPYAGGGSDAVVVKVKADTGVIEWVRLLGSPQDETVRSVAVDAQRVYIGGVTTGALPGCNVTGMEDAFIAAYSAADGTLLWIYQFGAESNTVNINTITVDGSWLYVGGSATASIDGQIHQGGHDILIAKYDINTGDRQWLQLLGTPEDDKAEGILMMTHVPQLAVTGITNGPLMGRTHVGGRDIFIGQWDDQGGLIALIQVGSTEDDDSSSITQVDGQLLIGGWTRGSLATYSCTNGCGPSSSSIVLAFNQTTLARTLSHQYESGVSANAIYGIASLNTGSGHNDIWVAGRSAVAGLDASVGFGQNDVLVMKPCIGTAVKRDGMCHDTCGIGRYPASAFCRPCAAGTFSASEMQPKCDKCDLGRYNTYAGASKCDDCHNIYDNTTSGVYTNGTGATICLACETGTFAPSTFGRSSCDPCALGTSTNDLVGQKECSLCVNGTEAPFMGLPMCSSCGIGTYAANRGTSHCATCAAGTSSDVAAVWCTACAAGSYGTTPGGACAMCASGYASGAAAATVCDQCSWGFTSSEGATKCDVHFGLIIGGAVAGLLSLICCLACYLRWRKKRQDREEHSLFEHGSTEAYTALPRGKSMNA